MIHFRVAMSRPSRHLARSSIRFSVLSAIITNVKTMIHFENVYIFTKTDQQSNSFTRHPRDRVLAATTLDRVAFISPGPGGEDPAPGHGIQEMCAAMAGAGARWLLARPLRAVCGVGGAVFLMASACGMAVLLPLSTLLGAAAAVLLPSLLRCAQLKHVPDGLQPKTLLMHFIKEVPYFSVATQNPDTLVVPCTMMLGCFRFCCALLFDVCCISIKKTQSVHEHLGDIYMYIGFGLY